MLRDIFLAVFNMSITASYIIAVVFLIRLIFAKKLPKLFSYALWGIVFLRLVIPFSLPSNFSIFNIVNTPQANVGITEYVSSNIDMLQTPQIDVGAPIVNDVVNSSLPAATPHNSVNPMQIVIYSAALIWLAVLVAFLLYYFISCMVIKTKLQTATLYRDNIFLSDKVESPIVFGILKPRIILPSNIEDICSETEIKHIIAHENVHIERFDHIIKLLSIIVLAVYWFNPLIWLTFVLSNKDRELACDERVMKLANDDIRAEYANSLVNIGTHKGKLIGSLAFGESNIKSRIKSIVSFKKPAVWISAIAIIIIAVIGVVCLTNSVSAGNKEKINQYLNTIVKENSVAFSSNPYGYINANSETFSMILALGDDGRNIMLEMFENTTDDGLKEYIMAIACNTIKPIMIDDDIDSGRAWYEAYKKNGDNPNLLYTPQTDYDRVKIKLFSYMIDVSGDEFETTDIEIVTTIDGMIKNSIAYPYEGELLDLNDNNINQYIINFSSKDKTSGCGIYYDTLYQTAFMVMDNQFYYIDTECARYVDSLFANPSIDVKMDTKDVSLFKQYGWTLDYKISSLNEKINETDILSNFDPNLYYFAYNNELSKDIGFDMSKYHNLNVVVEIYRIREEMPPASNPNKTARGIVVKKGNEIIGAFISAGRHSAFSACSLKGNFFEQTVGMPFEEWLSSNVKAGNNDAQIDNSTPEQVISTYFLALDKQDASLAKSCIAKKHMLENLTTNMPNDKLYNQFVRLPLAGVNINETQNPFSNLKSAKLIKTEWLNTPKGSETLRTYRVTIKLEYLSENANSNGKQWWDCIMIYESPQTGWKILDFGH